MKEFETSRQPPVFPKVDAERTRLNLASWYEREDENVSRLLNQGDVEGVDLSTSTPLPSLERPSPPLPPFYFRFLSLLQVSLHPLLSICSLISAAENSLSSFVCSFSRQSLRCSLEPPCFFPCLPFLSSSFLPSALQTFKVFLRHHLRDR